MKKRANLCGCGLVSPLAPFQWIFDCTAIVGHAAQTVILQHNKLMSYCGHRLPRTKKNPSALQRRA